jgi:LytS/YehU family sensor histidine kinase
MLAATAKNVLFGYGLVVVLVHITLRVRAHRAQEVALLRQAHLAAQAQLQILKLEMQPHFLFNALHSVSALIGSDPGAANDTLVLVSEMLRHAVDTARVQEVALHEELSALRLYTAIQEVRFGDRLRLTWEIADDTVEAAVPHMLLQPLVENSIKHGVEARSNAGKIVISAHRERDGLWLSIRDDGPGYGAPGSRKGSGLGIANVRNRLTQLYGDEHLFTVAAAAEGGTLVTIRIPFAPMLAKEEVERYRAEGDDRERDEFDRSRVVVHDDRRSAATEVGDSENAMRNGRTDRGRIARRVESERFEPGDRQ